MSLTDVITVINEKPQLAVGFVLLSVIVAAMLYALLSADIGVHKHVSVLERDVHCTDHSDYRLTWPRVDDEWTGQINMVCNTCNHTEPIPMCWSLVPWA